MITIVFNPPIADFFVRIGFRLRFPYALITGVHFDTAEHRGVALKVDLRTGEWEEIGRSDPLLKDDSVAGDISDDGAVYFAVSEEAARAGGGASTQIKQVYVWPSVFPALPAPVDLPARQQANAATKMAALALKQIEVLDTRLDVVEAA